MLYQLIVTLGYFLMSFYLCNHFEGFGYFLGTLCFLTGMYSGWKLICNIEDYFSNKYRKDE